MKILPIGIDLGTTNSCVAYFDPETPESRMLADDDDVTLLPSVIAQDGNGAFLVGWRAKRCENPLYRYAFVKRSMGTRTRFPFRDGSLGAAESSGHYLRELRERAERRLGEKVAAVVTVPAHFHENEQEDTRRAAKAAGLDLIELVREPVAAALAYHHAEDQAAAPPTSQILVYDLGGGTMDATICVRTGSHLEVGANGRAYAGDKFLGGLDFDKALLQVAILRLKKQGLEIASKDLLMEGLPLAPWLWELLMSAERTKVRLSEENEAHWAKEFVVDGTPIALDVWVKRGAFEELIKPKIDDTLAACDQALLTQAEARPELRDVTDRATKLREEINRVDQLVLVGGSTRVPYVKRRIEEHYRSLRRSPLPIRMSRVDECVAIGAAIYAQLLAGERRPSASRTQLIDWSMGPSTRVGDDVPTHDRLSGRVVGAPGPAWVVHANLAGISRQATVDAQGKFAFDGFPLAVGRNTLRFEIIDDTGKSRGHVEHVVIRGGLTADAGGLARPIHVRLIDGILTLLPAGTRSGARRQEWLYVNDTSGQVRVPLYEGHQPVGTLAFPLSPSVSVGTAVQLDVCYRPGRLQVEISVAGGTPMEPREVPFEETEITTDRTELWTHFVELSQVTTELLAGIPSDNEFGRLLRQRQEALVLDIRTDFEASGLFDPARIGDRLRQLESLEFQLRIFPTSLEGLKLRIENLNVLLESLGNAADLSLRQELDDIRRQLPVDGDRSTLTMLDEKLARLDRRVASRSQVNLTEETVGLLEARLKTRLQRIRADHSADPKIANAVQDIEATLESLRTSKPPLAVWFNRLWELDHGTLTPLYYETVVKRGQAGLLRRQA